METLSSISPDDAAALARLLGQLSTTANFDSGRLHAIIDHEATELLVARVGGEIVGMATFVSSPSQLDCEVTLKMSWSTSRYVAEALRGSS